MITEADITQASIETAAQTGAKVSNVSVTYRKDAEGSYDWTVTIAYRQAASRKGYFSSLDGYGETPVEAAKDAVATYQHAVDRGLVAK
jgi:hypothetical protein